MAEYETERLGSGAHSDSNVELCNLWSGYIITYQLNLLSFSSEMVYLQYVVTWVILLELVHTGNLQFLAIFCNIAANEYGILPKTS